MVFKTTNQYLPGFCFLVCGILFLSACETPSSSEEGNTDENENVETVVTEPVYDIDFLLGRFDPAQHEDFVLVAEEYSNSPGRYMHKEAYEAFVAMYDSAARDGFELTIVSATRNYDYQAGIWDRKWTGVTPLEDGRKATMLDAPVERAGLIMKYSAMPGTSRHHWGTDIDINALNNAYFEDGYGQKLFDWLERNAAHFGFARPYTSKETGRTGYEEEKWHWSYMPLSKVMTRDMATLFKPEMLKDFGGAETAEDIDVLNHYILGIDSLFLAP